MLRRTSRTLMSGIFLADGIEQIAHPLTAAGQPPRIPLLPEEKAVDALRAGGAMQVAGAVMLLTDVTPRLGAGMIAVGLLPGTLAGLTSAPDEGGRTGRTRGLLRDLALLGAATITALDTAGEPGLTWRAGRMVHTAGREVEWRRREAELLGQLARARAAAAATEARTKTVTPTRQVLRDLRFLARTVAVVSRPVRRMLRRRSNGS